MALHSHISWVSHVHDGQAGWFIVTWVIQQVGQIPACVCQLQLHRSPDATLPVHDFIVLAVGKRQQDGSQLALGGGWGAASSTNLWTASLFSSFVGLVAAPHSRAPQGRKTGSSTAAE